MVSPTPWKMHGFSHQFPIASIPDTLELKAKHIKEEEGMDVISSKKRNTNNTNTDTNTNTNTLGKSMPPYTKLSLLLTISFKNYNSYPKISTKIAATVTFPSKVSEGYSF